MAYIRQQNNQIISGLPKKQCDNCGELSAYYFTDRSRRLNATLCEKCFRIIPNDFFNSKWNGEGSEEFLMMLLKLK